MRRQNGITIGDVLNMECMEKCHLIAGHNGIHNTVSRVNIMADPDILDWVDEGEFLLTTAYSFKLGGIQAQKSFVKICSEKRLSGIGIKVYPYLQTFPQEVIELANELNFPIVEIDYPIPFSDIMAPIFKEIFNKQTSLLQRLEKVHEQLMDVVLQGGTIGDIGKVTSENLRNPVVIRIGFPDQWFLQLDGIEESLKTVLISNIKRFYDPNSKKKIEKKLDEGMEIIEDKPVRRMVMPIVVKDSIYGHIFSWALQTPLGGFDLSVLENASTVIALEVLKQLSIMDVENRYRSEFLEDLLSLDEKRKEKAVERASSFKLNIHDRYVIIVIQVNHIRDRMDTFDENLVILNEALEKILEKEGIKGIVVSKTDSIYILLSFSPRNKVDPLLKKVSNHVKKVLEDRYKKFNFQIGIGRAYDGLSSVYKSYMDALKALKASEILGEESFIYFEELGIYKILCQDCLAEELEKFYQSTIEPLVLYDDKKSTELVKTLEAYFEYNGNLKKISEVLFTHYNTTLYRIQRIQQITGMNLENSKDRLNLEIGLKIKKLLYKKAMF